MRVNSSEKPKVLWDQTSPAGVSYKPLVFCSSFILWKFFGNSMLTLFLWVVTQCNISLVAAEAFYFAACRAPEFLV